MPDLVGRRLRDASEKDFKINNRRKMMFTKVALLAVLAPAAVSGFVTPGPFGMRAVREASSPLFALEDLEVKLLGSGSETKKAPAPKKPEPKAEKPKPEPKAKPAPAPKEKPAPKPKPVPTAVVAPEPAKQVTKEVTKKVVSKTPPPQPKKVVAPPPPKPVPAAPAAEENVLLQGGTSLAKFIIRKTLLHTPSPFQFSQPILLMCHYIVIQINGRL